MDVSAYTFYCNYFFNDLNISLAFLLYDEPKLRIRVFGQKSTYCSMKASYWLSMYLFEGKKSK